MPVSTPTPHRRPPCGFTLIELLVVIAIIALLLGILLPTLGKARESGKTTVCFSNQKTLATAFVLYGNDNDDGVVSSFTNSRGWVDWPKTRFNRDYRDIHFKRAQDLQGHFKGIRQGKLWPYIDSLDPYHCPSDNRDKQMFEKLAWRTYSMPNFLNGDNWWEDYVGAKTVATQIHQIQFPTRNYAFLEESDPRGINMGSWVMLLHTQQWIDPLTVWHGDSGTIGFVDGHAEIHAWRDQRTIDMSENQQFNQGAKGNPDWLYLADRWYNNHVDELDLP